MIKKASFNEKPIGSLEKLALKLGVSLNELLNISNNSDNYYRENKPIVKDNGKIRQTYSVQKKLKCLQTRINSTLLTHVEYPDYLNGSLKGKSSLTNARCHTEKYIVLKEDIKEFYDSINALYVKELWMRLFNFPENVAECLTSLTTYKGFVAQGSPTSSYIANLIFWDVEPKLERKMSSMNVKYTRLLDDITISSDSNLDKEEKKEIISSIYGMLLSKGVRPNRKKHEVMPASGKMSVNGINVNNSSISIDKSERNKIRASVHKYLHMAEEDINGKIIRTFYFSLKGRLVWLKQFHERIASQYLKEINEKKPQLSLSEKSKINQSLMVLEKSYEMNRSIDATKNSYKTLLSLLDEASRVDKVWARPFRDRLNNVVKNLKHRGILVK